MRKHVVICDRCGAEEPLSKNTNYDVVVRDFPFFSAPPKWQQLGEKDLCPPCVDAVTKPPSAPEPTPSFTDAPATYRDAPQRDEGLTEDQLRRSLESASREVAAWPDWKKRAMRVLGFSFVALAPLWATWAWLLLQ